jgi:hypothetical protein
MDRKEGTFTRGEEFTRGMVTVVVDSTEKYHAIHYNVFADGSARLFLYPPLINQSQVILNNVPGVVAGILTTCRASGIKFAIDFIYVNGNEGQFSQLTIWE